MGFPGSRGRKAGEEFPAQVYLGGDGLGKIVVLTGLTKEQVDEILGSFGKHSREEVEAFFS